MVALNSLEIFMLCSKKVCSIHDPEFEFWLMDFGFKPVSTSPRPWGEVIIYSYDLPNKWKIECLWGKEVDEFWLSVPENTILGLGPTYKEIKLPGKIRDTNDLQVFIYILDGKLIQSEPKPDKNLKWNSIDDNFDDL